MAIPAPPNNLVATADASEAQRKRIQDRDRALTIENAMAWMTVKSGRGPRRGMR